MKGVSHGYFRWTRRKMFYISYLNVNSSLFHISARVRASVSIFATRLGAARNMRYALCVNATVDLGSRRFHKQTWRLISFLGPWLYQTGTSLLLARDWKSCRWCFRHLLSLFNKFPIYQNQSRLQLDCRHRRQMRHGSFYWYYSVKGASQSDGIGEVGVSKEHLFLYWLRLEIVRLAFLS